MKMCQHEGCPNPASFKTHEFFRMSTGRMESNRTYGKFCLEHGGSLTGGDGRTDFEQFTKMLSKAEVKFSVERREMEILVWVGPVESSMFEFSSKGQLLKVHR